MTQREKPQKGWLACFLDQGMFSDEIAVTYPPVGNPVRSVFVSRSLVTGLPGGRGKVQVVVVRKRDGVFAVLPTSQSELVAVTEGDLSDSQ